MNQDRRTYLLRQASDLSEMLQACDDPDHPLNFDDEDNRTDEHYPDGRDSLYLEVTPLIEPDESGSRDGAYVVEFLITCGGPTTRIVVDSRYRTVIASTDGPDDSASYPYEDVEIYGSDDDTWQAEAESIVEMYR